MRLSAGWNVGWNAGWRKPGSLDQGEEELAEGQSPALGGK
jgi:hypothetical protein